MATAEDPEVKKLPDETDGNNLVTPAETGKSKKKGFLGKSGKSDKGKDSKKEKKAGKEMTQEETGKDKKSEKGESKKEGKNGNTFQKDINT